MIPDFFFCFLQNMYVKKCLSDSCHNWCFYGSTSDANRHSLFELVYLNKISVIVYIEVRLFLIFYTLFILHANTRKQAEQCFFFFASHFTFCALVGFCNNSQNAGQRILHQLLQFLWLLHTLCTCVFNNRKQFAVSWFM